MVPRENKNNAFAKFGGTNKEYNGIFRTGLLLIVVFHWFNGILGIEPVIVNDLHFLEMQNSFLPKWLCTY